MKKLGGIIAVASISFVSAPAIAADASHSNFEVWSPSWYVEVRAGTAIPVNHGFNSPATGPGQYKPSSGFNVGVDIGRYLSEYWRAELGIYYNRGSNGNATLAGGAPIPHSGSVSTYSFMGNILYSFDFDSVPNLKPYLGVGLGFTVFDYNNLGATGGAFTMTGSDTVFSAAYHAGIDIKVSDRATLTSRYSLAWADGGNISTTVPGLFVTTSSEWEHIFGFGIRFDLN